MYHDWSIVYDVLGKSGGYKKYKYVETFRNLFYISMGQISEELYNFVKLREQEDLIISKQGATEEATNDGNAKGRVFKSSRMQIFQ